MKNLILSLIFIVGHIAFGQSGIIHYNKLVKNGAGELWATPYILYFDGDESLYIKSGKGEKLTEKYKDGDVDIQGNIISSRVIPSKVSNYYYTNKKNNEILFQEVVAEMTMKLKIH